MNSNIAFFHHFFPYIARPFEKVTAPLMINLLSQPFRGSFIIARSNGTKSGRKHRAVRVSLKTGKDDLPRTDEELFAFVRTLFGDSQLFCRFTMYETFGGLNGSQKVVPGLFGFFLGSTLRR